MALYKVYIKLLYKILVSLILHQYTLFLQSIGVFGKVQPCFHLCYYQYFVIVSRKRPFLFFYYVKRTTDRYYYFPSKNKPSGSFFQFLNQLSKKSNIHEILKIVTLPPLSFFSQNQNGANMRKILFIPLIFKQFQYTILWLSRQRQPVATLKTPIEKVGNVKIEHF